MAGSGREKPLITGFGHPLRIAILRLMWDRVPISPSELAAKLDESLSKVSYHVRELAKCGAIVPVEENPVRGSTKHLYKFAVREQWALTLLEEQGD